MTEVQDAACLAEHAKRYPKVYYTASLQGGPVCRFIPHLRTRARDADEPG